MRIVQLDKTIDTVLANLKNEDVYFLRLTKFRTKSGSNNYNFTSRRVKTVAIGTMDQYINDPDIALIKVEVDDA